MIYEIISGIKKTIKDEFNKLEKNILSIRRKR